MIERLQLLGCRVLQDDVPALERKTLGLKPSLGFLTGGSLRVTQKQHIAPPNIL